MGASRRQDEHACIGASRGGDIGDAARLGAELLVHCIAGATAGAGWAGRRLGVRGARQPEVACT
jgi:hypothetical protein